MKFNLNVNVDYKHLLILAGSAFAGGALAALQSAAIPTTVAMAEHDAAAAALAGLIAVIAMARKSFLLPPDPSAPAVPAPAASSPAKPEVK